MKEFLEMLQAAQSQHVKTFKGETGSYPSSKVKINRVAGATITKLQGMSFEEYDETLEAIDKYSKEWRQFKNDPNKIVIEKNFMYHALDLINSFFLIRPINEHGETYINVTQRFFDTRPNRKKIPPLVYLSAFVVSMIILSELSTLIGIIFAVCSFFVIAFYDDRLRKKYPKNINAWENGYSENPSALIKYSPCSFTEHTKYGWQMKSSVNIDFLQCPFRSEYEKMISDLSTQTHKVNGKIVWFWRYRRLPETMDVSKFTYLEDHFNDSIQLNINAVGSNIIPAIETKTSFIFFLDHYSQEMEKMQFSDNIFSEISRLKDGRGGFSLKPNMFSPFEFNKKN